MINIKYIDTLMDLNIRLVLYKRQLSFKYWKMLEKNIKSFWNIHKLVDKLNY